MTATLIPLRDIGDLRGCREGLIPACSTAGKWGVIALDGRPVAPFEYDDIRTYSEGLCAVAKGKHDGQRWGFLDRSGKLAIPCEYAYVADFCRGRALARKKDRYGFLDPSGKEAIPFKYQEAHPFSADGLAFVLKQEKKGDRQRSPWQCLRTDGKVAFEMELSCDMPSGQAKVFHDGLAPVQAPGQGAWGFVDVTGVLRPGFAWHKVWAFSEGRAAVAKIVGWDDPDSESSSALYQVGYVDPSGALVVPMEYGGAWPFSCGRARVNPDHYNSRDGSGRFGFIDREGKVVVPCGYEKAGDFSEGLAPVCQKGEWGFIDTEGKVVIAPRYRFEGRFRGGLTGARLDGMEGILDARGEVVVPFKYRSARPLGEGTAALVVVGGGGFGPATVASQASMALAVVDRPVAVDAAAARGCLDDAVERALASRSDREAQEAWQALAHHLDGQEGKAQRAGIIESLRQGAKQPLLLELVAVDCAGKGEHAAAEGILRRAIALAPGERRLHTALASVLALQGKTAEAEVATRAAPAGEPGDDLEAMHELVNRAYQAALAGRAAAPEVIADLERAVKLERKLLALWRARSDSGQDVPAGRGELSASALYIACLRERYEPAKAVACFLELLGDKPLFVQCLRDFPLAAQNTLCNGLGVLLDVGDEARVRETLGFVDERVSSFMGMLPYNCACAAARLKEADRALAYLGKATALDPGCKQTAREDPDFATLRASPEFARLVR